MVFDNYRKVINSRVSHRYLDVKVISHDQLYSIALEVIGNEHLTDAFMISEFGGFTQSEINRIKANKNYYQASLQP